MTVFVEFYYKLKLEKRSKKWMRFCWYLFRKYLTSHALHLKSLLDFGILLEYKALLYGTRNNEDEWNALDIATTGLNGCFKHSMHACQCRSFDLMTASVLSRPLTRHLFWIVESKKSPVRISGRAWFYAPQCSLVFYYCDFIKIVTRNSG